MKSIALAFLLLSIFAVANPIPIGDWAYIGSERLNVTLREERAEIVGEFTFRTTAANGKFDSGTSGFISIPIWVPESKSAPPELRPFLEGLPLGQTIQITDQVRPGWDKHIGMKITVGKTVIQPDSFSVLDYASRKKDVSRHPAFSRKGLSCLVVNIKIPSELIAGGQTVTISYQQPLSVTRAGREFYYVPILSRPGPSTQNGGKGESEFTMSVTNQSGTEMSLGGASIPHARTAVLPLSDMNAISIKSAARE